MPRFLGRSRIWDAVGLPDGRPGSLDRTFNGNGFIEVSGAAGDDVSRGVVIQPDGKIISAGYYISAGGDNDVMVMRHLTNGTLDASFGSGGMATVDVAAGRTEQGLSVGLLSDGRIVISGFYSTGSVNAPFVVCFETDGSLDTDFGTGGVFKFTAGDATKSASAASLAVQADDKIVLAGSCVQVGQTAFSAWTARITSSGGLDQNWGTSGLAYLAITGDTIARHIRVKPDDQKVYIYGDYNGNAGFFIARFSTAGSLDQDFASSGVYTRAVGILNATVGWSGAVALDNSPVLCGQYNNGSVIVTALMKLTVDGAADNNFGSSGIAASNIFFAFRGFMATPDGKYIGVGYSTTTPAGFLVARFTSTGAQDTTFNFPTGRTTTPFNGGDVQARGVAYSPLDNKAVVVGYCENSSFVNFATSRYWL